MMITHDQHEFEREADLLISRLIDRAASDDDRQRFDHLAAAEPTLWRELAVRLQDMGDLTEQVRDATSRAVETDLPGSRWVPSRVSWTLALSGWAAVIIIALSAGLLVMSGSEGPGPVLAKSTISPVEHYQRYVAAPFVMGEMQPVLVEVEPLTDGRIALYFIRRIEEVAFLDPNQALPVDKNGNLTKSLEELRATESKALRRN